MRTFGVKFKRKVVREYLSGKGGYKLLAAKFDIADSQVIPIPSLTNAWLG